MERLYRDEALRDLVRFRNADGPLRRGVVGGAEEYRSRFGRWNERASVRSKPRRGLSAEDGAALYFPPELVPVVAHPLVAALGDDAIRRLLVHRLHDYLHFTVELEQLAVIPVTSKISRGRAGLRLPDRMREDAFKITTDEAWHAQFSYELMKQVADTTGVAPLAPEVPQFGWRLDQIRRRLDPDLRGADDVVFSVVSETLISGTLSGLPSDDRLPTAVRALVADHAEDEGKHHAYFRSFLEFLWPAFDRDQRRRLGPWIPELIRAFLEPDYRAMCFALSEVGMPIDDIEQALLESYPAQRVTEQIAAEAQLTVRYFREVGALDDSETLDAFCAAGLVTDNGRTDAPAPAAGEVLRPACRDDGRAARRIVFDALHEYGVPADPDGADADVMAFGEPAGADGEPIHLVAEVGGAVAGVAVLLHVDRRVARLSKLVVRADLRGRGLGSKLLTATVDAAGRAGYREVETTLRDVHREACNLYESTGWVRAPDRRGTGPSRCYRRVVGADRPTTQPSAR